jgi:hypothetical protein
LKAFCNQYFTKLVIIDPLEKPALNLFASLGRDPAQLISDFSYIFSTTNQKMTGKQLPCFSFCARLLFTLPYANLFTLIDLLNDGTNKKPRDPIFTDAISKLPEAARRFFSDDFYSTNYAGTREEIKSRIWGVLENEYLSAMFNARTRKLDLSDCIKKRKIVLVNTRLTPLKQAHQILGRYIIALAQDAIMSRTERHPCFIFIDEFQEFADEEKTPQMLRLIREYSAGAVLAHQNMYCDELNESIRNAISTNTSIKYCASPEAQDLSYMARDLRCEPEFLQKMTIEKNHKYNRDDRSETPRDKVQFACFVRGMSPPLKHPFIRFSPIGWVTRWSQLSDRWYEQLKIINKFALRDDPPKVHDVKQPPVTHEATEKVASRVVAPTSPIVPQPFSPATGSPTNKPIVPHPKPAHENVIDPSKGSPWKRR